MNENKIKLILIVANMPDEMCENVIDRINARLLDRINERLLANEKPMALCIKAWKESEHPRANDGKFTDLIGKGGETPRQIAEREYRYALKAYRKKFYGEPTEDHDNPLAKKALEAKKRLDQIKALEPEIDRREKMTKKAKEFYQVEDDIDAIEELYGDNVLGGPLKFPSDDKGKAERKRYKKLKRRSEVLKAQINWDDVDDDEINAEREAASKE